MRAISQTIVVLLFILCCSAYLATTAQQQRRLNENFRMHAGFRSKFLPKDRDIVVWLPPNYNVEPERRFPVLYMHDGANVFILWRLDEIAEKLIAAKEIEPLIIVGVPHGGSQEDRFNELTPTRLRGQGGKADLYARMLVEELKPSIDMDYRTLTEPAHTAVGGTSLGGLASLYLGLKHPGTFGNLAVMSPSVWWDNRAIVREVKALQTKPALRIWLDVGTDEGGMTASVKELRDALVSKGWALKVDLLYLEAKGEGHNEPAWARRAGQVLKYLFPSAEKRSQP